MQRLACVLVLIVLCLLAVVQRANAAVTGGSKADFWDFGKVESGKPVAQSTGLKVLPAESGGAVFAIGSGTYTFNASAPRPTALRTD
jgi:hypothetical protein